MEARIVEKMMKTVNFPSNFLDCKLNKVYFCDQ